MKKELNQIKFLCKKIIHEKFEKGNCLNELIDLIYMIVNIMKRKNKK